MVCIILTMAKTPEGDAYQKAQRRIADASRDGATQLDLAGLQLTVLPAEIGALSGLKELALHGNRLSVLPAEIGTLTALHTLSLSGNQLSVLPAEIGALTAVQTLYLAGNQLTVLPAEIGALTALQSLYLMNNRLAVLPPEIGALTALQTLDLDGSQLAVLPPEIGALNALQSLDLRSNRLTVLPAEIGALTALQSLYLMSNQLTVLPAEIGALTALQTLDLHANQLTTLPPEIGALTALGSLDLMSNRLAVLPAEIGALSALQTLDLRSNRVTVLPAELGQLPNLTRLFLHDNPDLGLPPEILGPRPGAGDPKPPREILEYYFAHRRAAEQVGTEPLMEAKVLVLGEARVGKTCLIAAISENKRRDEIPDKGTSGIVRKYWPAPVDGETIAASQESPSAETLRLNLWDFGGQEIYHSAHTLFLTERAIYLIVISKRDNERQNNTDYWLKMAASFGGPEAATYLVVNQIDEKVGHPPDEEALRRRHPHLRGFLYTSCDDLAGVPEVRKTIVEEALRLKGVRLPVARTWLAVKTKLETMPEHTLSMQDWVALCGQDVSAAEARRELLHLCDRLGTVRYFPAGQSSSEHDDPPELLETAILNPEWVTLGIYALFDDETLVKRGGLLNRKQMAETLSRRGYPPEQERIIEEVMRRFDLLYDSAEHGEQHRMLIPVMLPQLEPAFEWPKEEALEFVYQYAVMPAGLIPAFMARMHKNLSRTPSPWRYGCVLDIKDCRVRVIGDRREARVSISVDGPESLRRDALDHVRAVFDALHATVRDLGEKELIPVPEHPEAPMLDYRYVRKLEWAGIREFHADGAPGALIKVNVAEALDGVRGELRRKRDEEQRQEQASQTVVHGDLVLGHKQVSSEDRSVSVGGDAAESVITTGDRNINNGGDGDDG